MCVYGLMHGCINRPMCICMCSAFAHSCIDSYTLNPPADHMILMLTRIDAQRLDFVNKLKPYSKKITIWSNHRKHLEEQWGADEQIEVWKWIPKRHRLHVSSDHRQCWLLSPTMVCVLRDGLWQRLPFLVSCCCFSRRKDNLWIFDPLLWYWLSVFRHHWYPQAMSRSLECCLP